MLLILGTDKEEYWREDGCAGGEFSKWCERLVFKLENSKEGACTKYCPSEKDSSTEFDKPNGRRTR
jgi:hypothetical protein